MTDELVRSYMHDSATPLKYKEVIAEALASIPRLSHIQFCQHLVFLHQCVNHKEISVLKLLGQRAPQQLRQSQQHLKSITENMENKKMHNTYQFECETFSVCSKRKCKCFAEFFEE